MRKQTTVMGLVVTLLLFGIMVCLAETEKASLAGKIAFIREGNIWLADAGGSNQRQLTKDGNFTRPSWSPDGKYLVCERHFKIGKGRWQHSVWLLDVEKVQAKRLPPSLENGDMYPTFSSDGRYVIYLKQQFSPHPFDYREVVDCLSAIDLQTLKQTVLAKEGPRDEDFSEPQFVSPCSIDGIKDIVYATIPHEGGIGVSLFRLKSGVKREWVIGREDFSSGKTPGKKDIFAEVYGEPAISPDRKYIASIRTSFDYDQSGEGMAEKERIELCLIRIGDKDIRVFKLPREVVYSNRAQHPSFSPGNRYIILTIASEEQWIRSRYDWGSWYLLNVGDIWIFDFETGKQRLLIRNGVQPAWSPR